MIINGIGPRFRGGLCFVKLRRLLLLLRLHALGNLMAVRHLARVCTEMHTMTHPVPAVCLAWDSLFAPSFTN